MPGRDGVIDVAITPAGLRSADVAVVIDVLRATSTATQALAVGYERVLCVPSVEQAALMRAPGRVLAGERRCLMPDGFDQGNSPADAAELRGRELVLATTNGAPAIVAAVRHARRVMLACLLNLSAVVEALSQCGDLEELRVLLVCAGTDGEPALEDTYLAGAISAALPGARTDAALIAESVTSRFSTAAAALHASTGAAALRQAGLADDIQRCARVSRLDLVPRASAADGEIAVVALDDADSEQAWRHHFSVLA